MVDGATISDSARIVVRGDLDVTGLSSGTFTIASGQDLVADGGSITATGKTVRIEGSLTGGAGDPAATTMTGDLDFAAGSIFNWRLETPDGADPGSAPDQGAFSTLSTSGSVGGSGAIFQILLDGSDDYSDSFWNSDKIWNNLLSTTDLSSIFSSFGGAGVTTAGLVPGQGSFSFSGGSLAWTAVPEPSGALAALLLSCGLLHRRRGSSKMLGRLV